VLMDSIIFLIMGIQPPGRSCPREFYFSHGLQLVGLQSESCRDLAACTLRGDEVCMRNSYRTQCGKGIQ
jgi:hypothetical protein